ncbi:uncharacterized protein LOC142639857 [Castanea sativa]|uniref:uncharacterized protein LOC142639857 n=1 Tax=Castanea sativa TaxID=21020 RepID=UPI003F64C3F9
MYPDLYKGLKLRPKDLGCYDSPLIGFNGKIVFLKGQIELPVQTGSKVMEVNFIMVNAHSPYTAIVVRPWFHAMGDVPSTLHLKVKYLSGDQQSKVSVWSTEVVVGEARCKELKIVVIGTDEDNFFQVGVQLPPQEKEELVVFLRRNIDVFAWNAYEALRVDPNFIFHHLNVNPSAIPKKQSPQRSSKEHFDAVREEVTKLKRARAIKVVFYLEWLANIVDVKKKSGKWQVCVDFADLNKACPKDAFPMP